MRFTGKAKRLDDIDLPREGAAIGVGEDVLHVFLDVESRGRGFDNDGRLIALFEPHKFYQHLPAAKRDRAVKAGLAYAAWKPGSYPKDSYPRILAASQIDETAALKSASWGLFQVMGENYAMCGFKSVQDMVSQMVDDEEVHLRAAINFIKAAKIDDDLRRIEALKRPTTPGDWVPIVSVYNGPGYKKNNYHVKASESYNKWRKIKDTPFTPGQATVPPAPPPPPPPTAPQVPQQPVSPPPAPPPPPVSANPAPAPVSEPPRSIWKILYDWLRGGR